VSDPRDADGCRAADRAAQSDRPMACLDPGDAAEELERLDWKDADLKSRRKNDPDKLQDAARLRRETTLAFKAIAARVSLETSKAANGKLHRRMREGATPAKAKRAPLE
jgi:hypothetical protein